MIFLWKQFSDNEPPPPTADEIARAYCRKILTLSQKGEWEVASETLKVNKYTNNNINY